MSIDDSTRDRAAYRHPRWRRRTAFVLAGGVLVAAFVHGIARAGGASEPVALGSDASPAQGDSSKTPDVIYVPTPQPVVDKMLELARPKKGDLVYDLGCGDGRIVVTAAKRFGNEAVGFDIDPARVAEARANVKSHGVEHLVRIEQRDIFTVDLSPANVVTLYLLPELNVRLIPQLERLKAGSRIVSHDFDMRGIKPQRVVKLHPDDEDRPHLVYLWSSPLVRDDTNEQKKSTRLGPF